MEVGESCELWTVIAPAELLLSGRTRPRKLRQWLCRCACGSERVVLEKNLRNGRSTGCGCVTSLGNRWNDALIEQRLEPHIARLGRMPTSPELIAVEGNTALSSAVAHHGSYAGWARRLGVVQSGGTVHRGQRWEEHEAAFFCEQGCAVEAQATKAPFDLLVNGQRVDVKSATWGDYGPVRGFIFCLKDKDHSVRCDFFDLVCVKDDQLAHRFVVPAKNASVQTVTITERTLGGFGKYSKFMDAVDPLLEAK